MVYDLDLLKGEDRQKSLKFTACWNWFKATDLPMAWGWELAVLVQTPGIGFDHLRRAFSWAPAVVNKEIPLIINYFANSEYDVKAAAQANYESITLQDGFDFLHALLRAKPRHSASVPLCVSQSLRQLRADGVSREDIAKGFGTTPKNITKFWTEDRFDPFTGKDFKCVKPSQI